MLRHCSSRWKDVLVIVKPERVVGWHLAGFRLYWRWRSRPRGGRPKIPEEIRVLIRRLADENLGWGAPRIHGELQKLGFVVAERSVARYLRGIRRRGDPAKRWLTFLQNHREAITAFDFFAVPTVTFKLLYCFPAPSVLDDKEVGTRCGCGISKRRWERWESGFWFSKAPTAAAFPRPAAVAGRVGAAGCPSAS
jgi:hypothetical protein